MSGVLPMRGFFWEAAVLKRILFGLVGIGLAVGGASLTAGAGVAAAATGAAVAPTCSEASAFSGQTFRPPFDLDVLAGIGVNGQVDRVATPGRAMTI